jgi:hypothetical protein
MLTINQLNLFGVVSAAFFSTFPSALLVSLLVSLLVALFVVVERETPERRWGA